jgi:hypothetical protein
VAKQQSTATGPRERVYPGVRCVTFVPRGTTGEIGSVEYFDVPAESYSAGQRTGTIAAWELVRASRNGEEEIFRSVIDAALKAIRECKGNSTEALDKCGAAVGLVAMISQVLDAASRKTDVDEVFIQTLKFDENRHEELLKELKFKNAALIAEMTAPQQAVRHG